MYNLIVDVNKKFKSSVNLQFDLNNEEKILQYVPTTDLCDVIKNYVRSFLSQDGNRSTILAGPYGKGKSYLMLMITYLVSKRTNRELFDVVVSKFRKIDSELADLITELDEKKISLLPVMINNNNSEDFNQNFMIALSSALNDNGMSDIVPNSIFNECLSLIKKWESEDKKGSDILEKCRKILPISLVELKRRLKNYDKEAYVIFEQLFTCVTYGAKFNAFVSNDIALLYSDVSKKVNKYGYKGLFVVFDEFGVFLENQTPDFISRLNKIQNLSEKCSNSNIENQLHLCCITHKDVVLYSKNKNANAEFVRITGRFKKENFDRSIEENYEIICLALQKKSKYNAFVKRFVKENNEFIESVRKTEIFSNEQLDFIIENGLPFNPISLYAMVSVSERVGQNERTMFTFLSDNDANTFRYFILNNEKGLLNVPSIYDYFAELIKDDENYKGVYYQVESLKKLNLTKTEEDIIKTIGIINIINDDIKYPADIDNIRLSLHLDDVKDALDDLINKNYLKLDSTSKWYDFSVLADKVLNEKINECIETKLLNKSSAELINMFDKNIYHMSNRYNLEYEMTRYYKSKFVEYDIFRDVVDCKSFLDGFADGLIINLLNVNGVSKEAILEMLYYKGNNGMLIVRCSEFSFDNTVLKKIKTVEAAKILLLSKIINEIEKNSLQILIDDLSTEIDNYIHQYCSKSICINSAFGYSNNINEMMFNSLVDNYNRTAVLINDQINKNIISKVSAKARDAIVDDILKQTQSNFSTTSAEATIRDSFMIAIKNNYEPINVIREMLINSNGNHVNVRDIVSILIAPPYGMRIGVIPLYIAQAISTLLSNDDNVNAIVLYNRTKEVDLNSSNIDKSLKDDAEFSLVYREIDNENLRITNELIELFGAKLKNNFSEDIKNLVSSMKNYVYNLEPIIVSTTRRDNILNLTNNEIIFKDTFISADLNPYHVLFEQIPLIFNDNNVLDQIRNIRDAFKRKIKVLKDDSIARVKELLMKCESSIKSCFDLWSSNYPYIDTIIFNDEDKKIYKAFQNIQFSDDDAINKLSVAIVNCTINDWNTKKQDVFFAKLSKFIECVENYVVNESTSKENFEDEILENELSFMGKTLMSNLQVSLDEYGESISNEEKALILKQLLKDILN